MPIVICHRENCKTIAPQCKHKFKNSARKWFFDYALHSSIDWPVRILNRNRLLERRQRKKTRKGGKNPQVKRTDFKT